MPFIPEECVHVLEGKKNNYTIDRIIVLYLTFIWVYSLLYYDVVNQLQAFNKIS